MIAADSFLTEIIKRNDGPEKLIKWMTKVTSFCLLPLASMQRITYLFVYVFA